jgi:8-oxo-dGTP diphosphatase
MEIMGEIVTSTDLFGKKYQVSVDELVWRPAAYGIIINEGSILLTKQHNALHLPGGAIEFGEMPEQSVIREVKEETGMVVEKPRLAGQITTFYTHKRKNSQEIEHVQSLLLYYRCDFIGGTASIKDLEEGERSGSDLPEWIPITDLDSITAGSTIDWRSLVKKVLRGDMA